MAGGQDWFYKAFTGWNLLMAFLLNMPHPAAACCHVTYCHCKIMVPHKIRTWDFQTQCCLGPKLGLYKIKGSWNCIKLYFLTFDGITFLSWDSDYLVTDFLVKPLFFQHLFFLNIVLARKIRLDWWLYSTFWGCRLGVTWWFHVELWAGHPRQSSL